MGRRLSYFAPAVSQAASDDYASHRVTHAHRGRHDRQRTQRMGEGRCHAWLPAPERPARGTDADTRMTFPGPNNLQVYAEPVRDDFDGTEFDLVKPGERYDMKLRSKIEDSP